MDNSTDIILFFCGPLASIVSICYSINYNRCSYFRLGASFKEMLILCNMKLIMKYTMLISTIEVKTKLDGVVVIINRLPVEVQTQMLF